MMQNSILFPKLYWGGGEGLGGGCMKSSPDDPGLDNANRMLNGWGGAERIVAIN